MGTLKLKRRMAYNNKGCPFKEQPCLLKTTIERRIFNRTDLPGLQVTSQCLFSFDRFKQCLKVALAK